MKTVSTLARTLTHQTLIQNTQCVPALKITVWERRVSWTVTQQIIQCWFHRFPELTSVGRSVVYPITEHTWDCTLIGLYLSLSLELLQIFILLNHKKKLKLVQSVEQQELWLARLPKQITADQRTHTFKLKRLRNRNCKCEV